MNNINTLLLNIFIDFNQVYISHLINSVRYQIIYLSDKYYIALPFNAHYFIRNNLKVF